MAILISMSFYLPSSESGGSNELKKPKLNEGLINRNIRWPNRIPYGTFAPRTPEHVDLESRYFGDPPFFTNAKPASMLERGWVRHTNTKIPMYTIGLLTFKDGPEIRATFVRDPNPNYMFYSFITNPSPPEEQQLVNLPSSDRYEEWNFYTPTAPVAFVPRQGGYKHKRAKTRAKKRVNKKRTRKTYMA